MDSVSVFGFKDPPVSEGPFVVDGPRPCALAVTGERVADEAVKMLEELARAR